MKLKHFLYFVSGLATLLFLTPKTGYAQCNSPLQALLFSDTATEISRAIYGCESWPRSSFRLPFKTNKGVYMKRTYVEEGKMSFKEEKYFSKKGALDSSINTGYDTTGKVRYQIVQRYTYGAGSIIVKRILSKPLKQDTTILKLYYTTHNLPDSVVEINDRFAQASSYKFRTDGFISEVVLGSQEHNSRALWNQKGGILMYVHRQYTATQVKKSLEPFLLARISEYLPLEGDSFDMMELQLPGGHQVQIIRKPQRITIISTRIDSPRSSYWRDGSDVSSVVSLTWDNKGRITNYYQGTCNVPSDPNRVYTYSISGREGNIPYYPHGYKDTGSCLMFSAERLSPTRIEINKRDGKIPSRIVRVKPGLYQNLKDSTNYSIYYNVVR